MNTTIENLITDIQKLELSDNNMLSQFSISEMKDIWNGVGGTCQSKSLRKFLTWLGRNYLPAFFIHDLEFEFGGNAQQFLQANKRLKNNLRKIVSHLYKKYDVRYWIRQPICKAIQILCNKYGFENWNLY